MKTLILGKKSLGEAVPPVAQFVHLRRCCMNPGKRNELNASRGHRIKSGKLTAGGIQGQRKRLRAIAEKISSSDDIVLIKAVINLRDHTRQVVVGRRNHGGVGATRTANVLTCVWASRRIPKCTRNVWLG